MEDELNDLRDRNNKLKQKLNRFKLQADELKKVKQNFNSLIDELEDYKVKQEKDEKYMQDLINELKMVKEQLDDL